MTFTISRRTGKHSRRDSDASLVISSLLGCLEEEDFEILRQSQGSCIRVRPGNARGQVPKDRKYVKNLTQVTKPGSDVLLPP